LTVYKIGLIISSQTSSYERALNLDRNKSES